MEEEWHSACVGLWAGDAIWQDCRWFNLTEIGEFYLFIHSFIYSPKLGPRAAYTQGCQTYGLGARTSANYQIKCRDELDKALGRPHSFGPTPTGLLEWTACECHDWDSTLQTLWVAVGGLNILSGHVSFWSSSWLRDLLGPSDFRD